MFDSWAGFLCAHSNSIVGHLQNHQPFFRNKNNKDDLFNSLHLFLYVADPPFVAQDTLRAWQEKNHPWLELRYILKGQFKKQRFNNMLDWYVTVWKMGIYVQKNMEVFFKKAKECWSPLYQTNSSPKLEQNITAVYFKSTVRPD